MKMLSTQTKNAVLRDLANRLLSNSTEILMANADDVRLCDKSDKALYDRLHIKNNGVEAMAEALNMVADLPDPVGQVRFTFQHPNKLHIVNKSSSFGQVLIIYESRPDVTIEAAAIAFKAGNKILLKGGKEAQKSNKVLANLWQESLEHHECDTDWVRLLQLSRAETQVLLKTRNEQIDLIIPRGGERLIEFVKQYAQCPVLVSGRGNNFCFVDNDVDWDEAKTIILNAKLSKISACNALDKLLLHREIPGLKEKLSALIADLKSNAVRLHLHPRINRLLPAEQTEEISDALWEREFLDYELVIDIVDDMSEAVALVNKYSGRHSATIVTNDANRAQCFMDEVDAAAVYHNASTRFTDGGQFGLGAEMAISTDKLHHRGPLGLEHLVTNKWYVYGSGQIRS